MPSSFADHWRLSTAKDRFADLTHGIFLELIKCQNISPEAYQTGHMQYAKIYFSILHLRGSHSGNQIASERGTMETFHAGRH